ncbi:hypothetical protein [Bdellovibrio sp. KM01]|uniref:hypothetical protein n=1 Tax=Bdellovibrio sp. KM01 TaxID=2748865 RepID=UPI0015E90AB0|nr:hypothetical protein [Bdellovibrio sp. KM01]QLY24687.1 hypothetical protein HW988_14685 [Bdellovibrio sp. KM01]
MKWIIFLSLLKFGPTAQAHIPVLVRESANFPVNSTFLGKGDISRAVFTELTKIGDIGIFTFSFTKAQTATLEVLTPYCTNIPSYESYQPLAILIRGEMPIPINPVDQNFLNRLKSKALLVSKSNYSSGQRPTGSEAGLKWWRGKEVKRILNPGLYTVIVWSPDGQVGNYILGLQQNEYFPPSVQDYLKKILPQIIKGYCDPEGYSGNLKPIQSQ